MNASQVTTDALRLMAEDSLQAWLREATDLKIALNEHSIVAVTDPDGRITFVNDKFCAISKYTAEELLGQNHRLLSSGHHPESFFGDRWLRIKQGAVWHGEIKKRAKDGTFFWLSSTIVPFLDEERRPHHYVAISDDITARKEAEAELAEKSRVQQLLTELSTRFAAFPAGQIRAAVEDAQRLIVESFHLDRSTLWQFDERGQRLELTHCWQRPHFPRLPLGLSVEQEFPWSTATILRGEPVCFSSPCHLPADVRRDAEMYRQHGVKSCVSFPLAVNGKIFAALGFTTLDGERKWSSNDLAALKLIAQMVGNVVSRQRAELREEELRGELAHAMRLATLGELGTAFAHELKQPLTAILSNAQAAQRFLADGGIEPSELSEILADIVRNDQRAGAVIQHLRAMASKRPVARELCCPNDIVHEVAKLMQSELLEARVGVRLALAATLPRIRVVRVELQQVLVNLLINAIQAMKNTAPEFRLIQLETRVDADFVLITFRDHGHGIPPEKLTSVFDPFYSTKPGGLGVGLSICRRIIENHAGRIEAHHHDDGGASFVCSLPVHRTKVQ
jgi:PAS domain S-box-containing protein